jgi:dolichol-phosphate mannosyltransferase
LKAHTEIAEFEIVVCNDGSRDDTGIILDELASFLPELRPVHFDRNQGAAAALATAIEATRFEWVLLTDSDGQFPIENLSRMWAAIQSNSTPASLGIRQKKDSHFAKFGTWASGKVCNLVHGTRIADFNSAFKLIWGPLVRSLSLEAKGMNYSTEVTSRLLEYGIKLTEVEIEHRPRTTGKSSMKLLHGSIHRLFFVSYIALRQLLLRLEVLRSPKR